MEQRKIALVTGACGFMGRRMVEMLRGHGGYFIVGTDLQNSDDAPWDKFLYADLTRPREVNILVELIKRTYGSIDVVFHIAGLFDYSAPKEKLEDVNVRGLQHLCEALSSQGMQPRMIVWSAAGIYRFPTEPDEPRTESSPYGTNGAYLQSKLLEDAYARDTVRMRGMPITVIRPSGVYGPGAKYGIGHMITMAGLGMMGPVAPNTSKRRGSTVHVDDVCGAALFLAEQPAANVVGRAFNVCDDAAYTLDAVTRFIGKEVEFPFLWWPKAPLWLVQRTNRRLVERAKRLGRESLIHPDMSRLLAYDTLMSNEALTRLGWKPKYPDPLDGLRATIQWYRKKGCLGDANFHELRIDLRKNAIVWTILLSIGAIFVGFATRPLGNMLHGILSLLALVVGLCGPWLSYRLWFVHAGFKDLNNWTRPKR